MDYKDPFSNPRHLVIVNGSEEECIETIAIEQDSLAAGGNTDINGQLLGMRYLTLDKNNIIDLMVNIGAEAIWDNPFAFGQFQGLGTPRNGWTDEVGVKREPTPSDKGSAGSKTKQNLKGAADLVTNFITFMQNLVISLKARKEKIPALIVQQLLNQFLAGQLSITQILVQLQKDFIVK